MKPSKKYNNDIEEESRLIDSSQPRFMERENDFPKRSPIRRKSKQREGGVQQKHSRPSKDPGPEGPALVHPGFRLRFQPVGLTGRRVEPTARKEGGYG